MIEIRQLTIGSHVIIDGKRVKVFGIGGNTIAYLPSIVSSVCKEAKTEDVEPIAITAELLEELGFERNANKHEAVHEWEKRDNGIYIVFDRIDYS